MENCSKEPAISEKSGLLKIVLGGILGAALVLVSGCVPTYTRGGPYHNPPVYIMPPRQHVGPPVYIHPRPYMPRSPQFMPRPSPRPQPPRPHR